MNLSLQDLAPSRRAEAGTLIAALAIVMLFGLVLYSLVSRQADTAAALDDLEEDVAEVELRISPLISAPNNRYDTADTASASDGFVPVSGATCFRPGVTDAVVRVNIRWSWVEVPAGAAHFYSEDGGSTRYGEGRLDLDAGGCFEFEDFRQEFPPRMQADLDRGARGEMEIIFALKPTDLTDPELPVTANEIFVFSGPFTILD